MILIRSLAAVALLLAGAVGCEKIEGESVDYGPAVSSAEVANALKLSIPGLDPSLTKPGATVQYTTTQSIAGGQVTTLTGVTSLSVARREESGDTTVLTIVESRQKLASQPGEKVEKSARQFRLVFKKTATLAPLASSLATSLAYTVEGISAPLSLSTPVMDPADRSVSYHHLISKTTRALPPKPVVTAPSCRGVPGCMMTYNFVSFDQVAWRDGHADKTHFDFTVSPDVPQISGFNMSPQFPYYQGLVKSCVTKLIAVGEGREKTLLTECQQVQDFLYGP